MTEELEKVEEEISTRHVWCAVQMGKGEYSLDKDMPDEADSGWSVKEAIAEAIGTGQGAIYIDEVIMGYHQGWPNNRLAVGFHIAGSKIKLMAMLRFS